jgi:hypothetical protein
MPETILGSWRAGVFGQLEGDFRAGVGLDASSTFDGKLRALTGRFPDWRGWGGCGHVRARAGAVRCRDGKTISCGRDDCGRRVGQPRLWTTRAAPRVDGTG